MTTLQPRQYNRLKDEAKRLRLSDRTLERECKNGLPYIRLGRSILFDPEMTDQYLAERVHKGRAAELAKAA